MSSPSLLTRTAVLLYGVASYAIFFATFLYAIGFVGGFAVPHAIDDLPRRSLGLALAIDAALHSSLRSGEGVVHVDVDDSLLHVWLPLCGVR